MLMFAGLQLSAQQGNLIGITPFLDTIPGVPAASMRNLENKLKQVATQNGFGSQSGDFILTCNVVPIDRQAIPTMPVQYSVELEVSFYVINVLEELIVDEMSVNVSGLESNEAKAYAQAFMQINPRTPQMKTFMGGCREKICQYYTEKLPALKAQAQALASRDDYEGALAVLGTIPQAIPEYAEVAKMSSGIYVQMIDRDAKIALNKAKGALAQRNYDEALDCVNTIHPGSTLAQDANAMIDEIQRTIRAEEQFKYQEKLRIAAEKKAEAEKLMANQMELEKMRLEASVKKSVAHAKIVEQSNRPVLKKLRAKVLDLLN